jgi:hypothetical protein
MLTTQELMILVVTASNANCIAPLKGELSTQILKVATPRGVGADEPCAARPTAGAAREDPPTECPSLRFSVGENRRKKGEVYSFDGGKRVKGRRRHLVVDSLGLVLKVVVTEASANERTVTAYALL